MTIRNCRPCWKERGKVRPAVEIVDGVPWCSDCFSKLGAEPGPAAEEPRRVVDPLRNVTTIVDNGGVGNEGEGRVAEKVCGCGCGKRLRSDNSTGYRTGHQPKKVRKLGRPRKDSGAPEVFPLARRDSRITILPAGSGGLLEKVRDELAHHEHMVKQLTQVIELLEG